VDNHNFADDTTIKYLPLSYSQQNIWNLEMANPGVPINNICTVLRIEGNFNAELLQQCITFAYEAFSTLRTRITIQEHTPVQYIDSEIPKTAPFLDFSKTNQEGASIWDVSVAREHITLCDSSLCQMIIFKLSENTGGILTKIHHIIADAWSQTLVTNQIIHNYFRLLQNEAPDCTVMPEYAVHIQTELDYLASKRSDKDRAYWQDMLTDIPPAFTKEYQYAHISPVGIRKSYSLSNRSNRMIGSFCAQNKVSPFAVFYMVLAIYLKRIKGQTRFCIGVPTVNRINYQEKQTAGMFVNTLPFVNELDDAISFQEFNEKLKNDWFKLLYHQRFPFSEIKKTISAKESDLAASQLFSIALSYQNTQIHHLRGAQVTLEGRWLYSGYQAESLCVHLSSRDTDNRFLVDYDYLTQIFSEEEIDTLHRHLMQILHNALMNPDVPIADLSVISEEEEEHLIFDFNQTDAWYPKESALRDILRDKALAAPDRAAVICGGHRTTYGELYRDAYAIAQNLVTAVPDGNETVALLLDRSEDLFKAMCAVTLSGNAWLLLDITMPENRLMELLSESGAAYCITEEGEVIHTSIPHSSIQSLLESPGTQMTDFTLDHMPAITSDSLAYLVYTSGSTGKPKAVQIYQYSVLNLANNMASLYPKGAVLSICNVSFDAFLLESMSALLNGKTIVFTTQEEMNYPASLAKLIERFDVGFLSMTPSRLKSYLKEPAFLSAMNRIETIVCGGESLSPEIYQTLRSCTLARLYNQYGPSEATVAVSHSMVSGNEMITIGKPMANCRIYILDDSMRPLPIGSAGELYIGGTCLASGYLNAPELTAQKFVADPYIPGERLYRTGDLGYWNSRGEIVFQGRIDSQLKILGHRVEPAEIEEQLQNHPLVKNVAVRAFDHHLIAYFTSDHELDGEDLLAFASSYLPHYLLPVLAVKLPEIPLTANGKTDYKNLQQPELPDEDEAPADAIEEKLLEIWRRILSNERLGIHTSYFLSGGDSLNAVAMLTEVEAVFSKLPKISDLYANNTIRRFGNFLRGEPVASTGRQGKIPPAPERTTYPLTAAQKNFYVLQQLDPTGISYHMPGVFRVSSPIDADRLEAALLKLIADDEMLRTGFEIEGMQVISRIHKEADFHLERNNHNSFQEALAAFIRPFDLAVPPLFRVMLVETEAKEQYLLFDMHHIISDGISSALTLSRLDQYYRSESPARTSIRYRDYAWWMEQQPKEWLLEQREYWKNRLQAPLPQWTLPTDRPRPKEFVGAGGKVTFNMPENIRKAFEEFCKIHQVTPYMLLLSVYALMLSKFSRNENLIIGSPVSGRRHVELAELTGVFVNTLPVLLTPSSDKNFMAYLKEVKQDVLDMLEHQDLSLEEIVNLAPTEENRGSQALYHALFSLAPVNPSNFTLGDAHLNMVPADIHAVKMELHLETIHTEDGYRFTLEYAKNLFDQSTMEFYSRSYLHILETMLNHPEMPLSEVSPTAPLDQLQLLEIPNQMRMPYDAALIDQMTDRYALLSPQSKAVCWGEHSSYTFAQLKQRSDSLAVYLIREGVLHGDVVAFMPKRDGDMPVTMLGILKAGAAYLPVDPDFPTERISYMLENAKARLLLLGESVTPPAISACPVLPLDFTLDGSWTPELKRTPEDVLNVIYTSGSTGKPKGVMMVHKAISNLSGTVTPLLGESGSRILCASNCVFDVFTTETLLALANGRCISIADEEEMLLPWKLAERIAKDQSRVIQMTPSRLQMCLGDTAFCEALKDIEIIILLGEPWTLSLRDRIRELSNARIYNIYGPTETSVHNCMGNVTDAKSIHIGKPIGNCRYYLLDENGHPLPPTAIGEIYIAGECLAAGYINREDLTNQVFVPDLLCKNERMYKTGDLGRLRADGNWQCLGRVDNQLKLNGHRIEPEEIASQIIQSRYASEAAVVPVRNNDLVQSLRAYLVPANQYTEEKLRDYLLEQLPDYMIPSVFVPVSALPRTASGKLDIRLLMEMEAPKECIPDTPQGQAPVDPQEALLQSVWEEALGKKADWNVSFFKQGGTSLTAIMVLSQYYKNHIDFSLNDFYSCPTLAGQIEKITGRLIPLHAEAAVTVEADEDFEKLARFLPKNNLSIPRSRISLLTGATGYLGAHLLYELLGTGIEKLICLVRTGGEQRLKEVISSYFGESFYSFVSRRIEIVNGDITIEHFGISKPEYERLTDTVDMIIHCAADVRHYAPGDELVHTNTHGTENVIAFAKSANASFIHISTISVAGEYIIAAPGLPVFFSEHDLDMGQNWMDNPYTKSKILAEALVAAAIENGLNARIFRVGRLVSRAKDGVFQLNPDSNAFYRIIQGLLMLKKIPREFDRVFMELTSVDLCAEAIVKLLYQPGTAFHVINPQESALGDILKSCCDMELAEREEFEELLRDQAAKNSSPFIQAVAEAYFSGTAFHSQIQIQARDTAYQLEQLGFTWPRPDLIKISRCFDCTRKEE